MIFFTNKILTIRFHNHLLDTTISSASLNTIEILRPLRRYSFKTAQQVLPLINASTLDMINLSLLLGYVSSMGHQGATMFIELPSISTTSTYNSMYSFKVLFPFYFFVYMQLILACESWTCLQGNWFLLFMSVFYIIV